MGWTVYNSDGKILQSAELGDNAVTTVKIIDDAVTYAKMQNLATADRVLGSTSTGVIGEVQIVPDMLATNAVTNVKVATGIDAVKLADGSVTNAELQYINSLSSNAQTQIAAKQATIDSSARLNANLIHDGSVTNTEFGYISTLSSNAQTQLTAKQATIDSSARLDAASIGANGNVSNTEYGYLSGVTSDIQTQLNAAGGAVARKGGNTTEASTTSTGATEFLQATSLDIAATAPFKGFAVLQKTTGHASTANTGWYLNGTRVSETIWTSANNGLEGGGWYLWDVARLGNPYEGHGMLWTFSGDGGHIPHHPGAVAFEPTGTTGTIGVLGRVANASNTMKADEFQVYDYTLS